MRRQRVGVVEVVDSKRGVDARRRRDPAGLTSGAQVPVLSGWPSLQAFEGQNPEDRSEVLGGLLENMGGRLLSFYYSFGEYDGVFIWEAPDEGTAATTVLAALSPGHVKAIKTTAH